MKKRYFVLMVIILFGVNKQTFSQTNDSIKSRYLQEVIIKDSIIKNSSNKESHSSLDNIIIEKIPSSSVGDLAKFIAGVNVKDYGGVGGLKTISVRGLGSNHSAIIYDGISVSDFQTGQVDLSKFSSSNIKEINLYNGNSFSLLQPARSLASANAFLIETQKPYFNDKEKFKLNLNTSYGSFNYSFTVLNAAFKINDIWSSSFDFDFNNCAGNYPYTMKYGIFDNDSTSKEKRKNSDYLAFRGEWNVFASFNSKTNIKLKSYYFTSERGLPMSTSYYYLNSKQRLWDENFFLQSIFTHRFNKKLEYRNHLKALYSYTHYYDSNFPNALGYQRDKYYQREFFVNNVFAYSLHKNTSLALSNDIIFNNLNSASTVVPYADRLSSITALSFLYDDSKLLINSNVLHHFIQDNSKINPTTHNLSKHFSPFVSIGYTFFNSLTISAFYKDVFRMPTFNDLYFNKAGISNLKPETTQQFNLHLEYYKHLNIEKNNSISFSLDIYNNTVKDKIVALPQRNLFVWSIINYGKVRINGMDLQTMFYSYLSYSFALKVRGTYSFQKSIDITDKESKTFNNQIPYIPLHSGTLFINLNHNVLDISYSISFVGKRYSLAENIKKNELKPYQDHTITISKDFLWAKNKVNIGVSCLNLLGTQYEIVKNYPMPLRQFRINLKIDFK